MTMQRTNSGFILIAVLWLLALFSIVALGYSRTTRNKSQEIINELLLAQEDRLFDSGLEMAEFQYQLYVNNRARFLSSGLEDSLTSGQRSIMWYPRYETYVLVMDSQELYVRVEPVGARMALSAMTGDLWFAVLGACGIDDEEERLAIISAVADWQDGDSLLHLEGAEQEYYDTLNPPYACKNAPIENLEELMLVRGITPEIFYGTENKPGLRHFLCMEGKSTKLDINSASPLAFDIVEDLTDEEIAEIIAMRQEYPIVNLAEVQELTSLVTAGQLAQYFHALLEPAQVQLHISRSPAQGTGVRYATRTFSK